MTTTQGTQGVQIQPDHVASKPLTPGAPSANPAAVSHSHSHASQFKLAGAYPLVPPSWASFPEGRRATGSALRRPPKELAPEYLAALASPGVPARTRSVCVCVCVCVLRVSCVPLASKYVCM